MPAWAFSPPASRGLDFIPVATERYDLVIPSSHIEDEKVQKVLETIRSEEFKAMVLRMGAMTFREQEKN